MCTNEIQQKNTKQALAASSNGDHVHAVSHSELLSYTDFLYLCEVSFYFQHQQQQNILSLHDVGQIFIQVKEGGGHGLHSGHITFDEFMYTFALMALAMTRAVSLKFGVSMDEIANSDADMIKALLHRMMSCPGYVAFCVAVCVAVTLNC